MEKESRGHRRLAIVSFPKETETGWPGMPQIDSAKNAP